jgi:CHAT domain-containing protein/tetratricopeptide (TPR) repeat protein
MRDKSLSWALMLLLLGGVIASDMVPKSVSAQTAQDRKTEADQLLKLGKQQQEQGQSQEALKTLQRVLILFQQSGDRLNESYSLNYIASIYDSIGQYSKALEFYQQALTIAKEINNRDGEGGILSNIGGSYRNLKEYSKAIIFFQQALTIAKEINNHDDEGLTLSNIGEAYRSLGENSKAVTFFQKALEIAREIRNHNREIASLNDLGAVYGDLQEYSKALDFFQQAIAVSKALKNRAGEAHALNNISAVHNILGNSQKALEFANQALNLYRELGDQSGIGSTLYDVGVIYHNLGKQQDALIFYNQALQAYQVLEDQPKEASILYAIGNIYSDLGESQKSLEHYNQALKLYDALGDLTGKASTLNKIGISYANLGKQREALKFYEQSLSLYRSMKKQSELGPILSNIGLVYFALDDYQKALEFYNQALPIQTAAGNQASIAATLHNIGGVYAQLGDNRKALDFLNRALSLRQISKDKSGEAKTLNNIGSIYRDSGKLQKALEFYYRALALRREAGDRLGIATMLNNIGVIYLGLDDKQKALEFLIQALPLRREVGDQSGEGSTLNNIGLTYLILNNKQRSLEFLTQALTVQRAIKDRSGEATTLYNIGLVFSQKQPKIAIIFLKQSISNFERIRFDIRGLPKENQESYTKTIAHTYRQLADLLLKENRILEAQQVLDLLKVEELEDYLRNTRTTTDEKIIIRRPEEEIISLYDKLQKTAIQLGQERAELSALNAKNALNPAQETRLDQLKRLETAINRQFNQFLDSEPIKALLNKLTTDTQQQAVDPTVLNGLRDDLKTLNAVSLYPLILDDRLELIITTPNNPPVRRIVPVKKADLIKTITAYRSALKRPGNLTETQQLAQQLYDWLIKPIEQDLAQANPQTIIYAPDGALRYIPLATLYDKNQPAGKQWLAQRYQIQNITARSLINNFTTPRKPQLQIFAGAYGSQSKTVEIGTNRFSFSGIPFTLKEVNALGQTFPNTRILTEQAFSKTSTERQLDSFNIIHLATHGKFVVGKAENSFILLGNGDTITLPEIKDLSLANVDLIVLSACETGIGDILGGGEEILGLGYQFQRAGAKAAIASLWQVDDGGTQLLMNAFYKALQQGMTKSQALQVAQNALITSNFKSLGLSRSDIEVTSDRTGQPIPASQLSHPYYWAPFILIGNGL